MAQEELKRERPTNLFDFLDKNLLVIRVDYFFVRKEEDRHYTAWVESIGSHLHCFMGNVSPRMHAGVQGKTAEEAIAAMLEVIRGKTLYALTHHDPRLSELRVIEVPEDLAVPQDVAERLATIVSAEKG